METLPLRVGVWVAVTTRGNRQTGVEKGEVPMRIAAYGLIPARLRRPVNVLLYAFIVIQYVVLFLIMRQTGHQRPLPIGTMLLPVLYLGPVAICFGFRQRIGTLRRKDLLTEEVMNLCYDWITVALFMVYGIILDFRNLS